MLIAIEETIITSILDTLEATRQELAKIQERGTGQEPLTKQEAADYLKIHLTTLNKYIDHKAITPSEYGGRVWILRSELDAFLKRNRRPA